MPCPRLCASPSVRKCRCGRPLDPCGHHLCCGSGSWAKGLPLGECSCQGLPRGGCAGWHQCHGPGHGPSACSRIGWQKLEVVADGLSLSVQLAIDTALVAVLMAHPSTGADRTNGVALSSARQCKERTYPELRWGGGRATLVVLAAEVGRRWSTEGRDFLVAQAAAKAREAPFLQEPSVKAARLFRWSCMLACTVARSFALSLRADFVRHSL